MTSPPPMPGQPFTIRDGGKMWQHVLDGASVWGVTGPMYDDVGMPCLVVTGDLDAARARLAPPTLPAAYSPTDRVDAVGPRECVEFPCCGFAIDAQHIDASGDAYTCPLCDVTYQPPEKRARLAPLDEDTRTRAIEAADTLTIASSISIDVTWEQAAAVRNATVDALAAAGILATPHTHDDAAVERAARALYERMAGRLPFRWDALPVDARGAWLDDARAALAAAEEDTWRPRDWGDS